MNEHPIENLMTTAMNSIKDMVDVNTIVGDPIEASNNIVIIPISKVCFGFAAGGSEFRGETVNEYMKKQSEEQVQYKLPFGGGSGAGVNIVPVAFLVVGNNNVKLLPVDHNSCLDKLLDYVPDLMDKLNNFVNKKMQNKKEEKNQINDNINENADNLNKASESLDDKEIENKTANQIVKPKKAKFHRPQPPEDYDFEYDETE